MKLINEFLSVINQVCAPGTEKRSNQFTKHFSIENTH